MNSDPNEWPLQTWLHFLSPSQITRHPSFHVTIVSSPILQGGNALLDNCYPEVKDTISSVMNLVTYERMREFYFARERHQSYHKAHVRMIIPAVPLAELDFSDWWAMHRSVLSEPMVCARHATRGNSFLVASV